MSSKKKTIIYYYFRGTLTSHVHFFQSWKNKCREEGLDIQLITVLTPKVYWDQIELVRKYKSNTFKIYCFPIPRLFEYIYFGINALYFEKIVVHLKKRGTTTFKHLKKVLSNLKYFIELEGDALSEADYLKKNPYKKGFYDKEIQGLELNAYNEKGEIKAADGVLFVTNAHKKLVLRRYEDINLSNKSSVQPMSYKKGELYFDKSIRSKFRDKLSFEDKFVIIYIGNVFYSWQNLGETLKVFKKIKEFKKNSFLQLLIRKQDHSIAKEFLEKYNINDNEYSLKSVPHQEIIGYLNAADLGVLFRKVHTMNTVVSSGKLVEYLACGLPTLTTTATSIYNKIKDFDLVYILNDYNSYNDEFDKLMSYLTDISKVDLSRRKILSTWANEELSMEQYISEYKKLVEAV